MTANDKQDSQEIIRRTEAQRARLKAFKRTLAEFERDEGEAPMKVEIDLLPWQIELLKDWRVSVDDEGSTMAEKIASIIDDVCLGIQSDKELRAKFALYRKMNMRHPHDYEDDDVPF